MKSLHGTLMLGNANKVMKFIKSESVHLAVTSPPYFGVNMWGDLNEQLLGIKNIWWEKEEKAKLIKGERVFNDYLADVWRESFRVLVPGGRLIINTSDVPSKQVGMWNNAMQCLTRCKRVGFKHRDTIIWAKGNQHRIQCSYPRPWGIVIANTFEYVLVLQKPGVRDYSKMSKKRIEASKLQAGNEQWILNPIWSIKSASAKQEKHCAPFPVELVQRLVKLYTYKGDTVLDPYCGTGTTLKVAKEEQRNFIGIELYEKYFPLISKKVGWNDQTLFYPIKYTIRKFKSRIRR